MPQAIWNIGPKYRGNGQKIWYNFLFWTLFNCYFNLQTVFVSDLYFCSSLKRHPQCHICNHDKNVPYGQYDKDGHNCCYGILWICIKYCHFGCLFKDCRSIEVMVKKLKLKLKMSQIFCKFPLYFGYITGLEGPLSILRSVSNIFC